MLPLSQRLAPSRFLDPALLCLVLLGVALFFALRGITPSTRAARVGRGGAWAVWGLFWLFALPTVADPLVAWTEMRGPDLASALAGAPRERTALVVLAAGLRTIDPAVPPSERLDSSATSRVLGAARLYHEHKFALVILSGAPALESEGMAELISRLGVPSDVIVREQRSLNTRENALYSARILGERGGFDRVVLATSATHLRRALKDFERAGVRAIPAAVDVIGRPMWGVDSLLPSAGALWKTHRALHEILGMLKP